MAPNIGFAGYAAIGFFTASLIIAVMIFKMLIEALNPKKEHQRRKEILISLTNAYDKTCSPRG